MFYEEHQFLVTLIHMYIKIESYLFFLSCIFKKENQYLFFINIQESASCEIMYEIDTIYY